jgi:predicted nucleic acid-binding protein
MRYLLDAGIVIALQRTKALNILAAVGVKIELLIVEEVYDEVVDPRGGKYSIEAKDARAVLDSHVKLVTIDPTSKAAMCLDALRSRKRKPTRTDLGEAASISWAVEHRDCTFVTRDAAAAYLALEELMGRVMSFFSFLRMTVDETALDATVVRDIGDVAPNTMGVRCVPPLWWNEWRDAKDVSSK